MLDPQNYTISVELFTRLLGLVYFFVYFAFIFQIKGLLGTNGILPIGHFLHFVKNRFGLRSYYLIPSVFWLNSSDRALMSAVLTGTITSILLMGNIYAPLMLSILYVLHLSITSTGQDFLSFGWEMFLLEITFHAIFLSMTAVPNIFIWISLNFLLFRFHFQAGAVKLLSGDPNWRNLTALAFHYQTQPLPNTQAWYIHKLPMSFHKLSTFFTHAAELIVPFGIIFGNQEIRLAVFFILFGLQAVIWFTGNFSYLNHLTGVFCIILISNTYLYPLLNWTLPIQESSLPMDIFLSIIGAILLTIQVINLWNHFFPPNQLFAVCLRWIQPFHLANRYGIFAVMTTKRYEVIVEGSDDGVTWKEYFFYFKPSEITRRPRRISPFQPRIDWQIWFLPFTNYYTEVWFQNFLYHLLKGTPNVLKLIRHNPFSEKPPQFIRAHLYDYVFSDFKTKKEKGEWWTRTYVKPYSPTLSLKSNLPPKS